MPLRDSSIKTRLVTSFGLILLMTLAIGMFAIVRIQQLAGLTEQLYDHPFIVSTETLQIRVAFGKADRTLADLIYASRPEQQEEISRKIAGFDSEIQRRLALVRERYLGPAADVVRIDRALAEWRGYRDLILDLSRARRYDQIETSLNGPGRDYAQAVEREIDVVIYFALNRARMFEDQSRRERADVIGQISVLLSVLVLLGLMLALIATRSIVRPLDSLRRAMLDLANGKLDTPIPGDAGASEVRAMAAAADVFKASSQRLSAQSWVKDRLVALTDLMQRAENPREFAETLIGALVPLVGGGAGLFHVREEGNGRFEPLGGYGIDGRGVLLSPTGWGEGLVGQSARQRVPIVLTDIPSDYCRIASGLGAAPPRLIYVVPVLAKGEAVAVIEIACFTPMSPQQQELIDETVLVAALSLEVLQRNIRTRELLEETRQQAEELRASQEELQMQSEELRTTNEELRVKSEDLVNQAEILRGSEAELQTANEALIEKGRALEQARCDSERRAEELDEASRYKSEFLANMSHELRTPLNSLLILSRGLADNEDGNLSESQIESARIIHESGSHLLRLINDILDLSKVEAGKMELYPEQVSPAVIATAIRRRFEAQAVEKGLGLTVEIAPDLPPLFYADGGKLDQILTNLVGNAIKFTQQGAVAVRLHPLAASTESSPGRLVVEVADTGIGVPADKLDHIFHAFEQADGTTSRQYGGTGLGLSISLRLAELMGGTIRVESTEGRGSTFTLELPMTPLPGASGGAEADGAALGGGLLSAAAGADDRHRLEAGDPVILIIEDDEVFSQILCDLARNRGFKCVRVGDGIEGLGLARQLRPTGILLDVGLPGLDGWAVMEALKHDPLTRPIPVHFISATNDTLRGLRMGAAGFLTKPVDRDQLNDVFDRLRHFSDHGGRRVLIVDDDVVARIATSSLVQDGSIEIREAETGEAALALLRTERFDCLILDLMLPDISGFDMLDRARAEGVPLPPVVIHSAKDLSYDETLRLRDYTDSIVIKSARSPERLLDEVTLFLHSVRAAPLPETPPREEDLAGRKILVVDDDMRNAFALSKTLRNRGFSVLVAEDGVKAVAQVDLHPDLDMVLMDIMMPGMDGYAAIAEIRRRPGRAGLPILALTAKAMPGDRERCLAAGANDHVPKPIDIDRLLELIRHWMRPREDEGA